VVIQMGDTWQAVVSLFAVLNAGAAFSILDPSVKADKLATILRHCEARAVVTQGALALVASDPALTQAAVIRHCQRHLEDVMVPKGIEFRTALPRTDTGKVSRRLAAATVLEAGE
jgi:acyl-coenzyme A synthetase/AMP-(fatty) acid ligase